VVKEKVFNIKLRTTYLNTFSFLFSFLNSVQEYLLTFTKIDYNYRSCIQIELLLLLLLLICKLLMRMGFEIRFLGTLVDGAVAT